MLNDCTTTLAILIAGLLQVETEEALACQDEQAPKSAQRGLSDESETVMRLISPAA